MVVKWVKKVMLEVPNVPVVTRVNQGRVLMARVKHVRRVNLVRPTMQHLIRAGHVARAIIKMNWVKHRVCHAYQEHLRPLPAQLPAMNVGLVNTNQSPMLQNALPSQTDKS